MSSQIQIEALPFSDFEVICHYLEILKKNRDKRNKIKKAILGYVLQFTKVLSDASGLEKEHISNQLIFYLDNIKIEAEAILYQVDACIANDSAEQSKSLPTNSVLISHEIINKEFPHLRIHESVVRRIAYTMTGLEAVAYLYQNGYYSREEYGKHVGKIIQSATFLAEFLKYWMSFDLNLAGVSLPELQVSSNNPETSQSNGTEHPGFEGADPSIVKAYKDFLN